MMRFLAVWFPHWSLVAADLLCDEPTAIITGGRVSQCSPAAHRAGVRIGQRRREAKGHSPQLTTVAPNPHLDAQKFEPIVNLLTTVVPRLEVSEPGLCTLVADGPSRYYGGELQLVQELQSTLAEAECPPARIGIADSRFASRLAASRTVEGQLVPAGRTKEFLADFPISTLGIEELSTLAQRLGIHTLGEFAALPISAVVSRFGSPAATAHALARGLTPTPLALHQPVEELTVYSELNPPAERVDIATFTARTLSAELMQMLTSRGLACTQLRIEAHTEHLEESSRTWRASPVFDAETIVERVRWQLTGWLDSRNPAELKPTSGITSLRLIADEVAGTADLQISLWGEMSQSDRRAIRGLDRVRGLLGSSAIFTAVIDGGRAPADRVELVPWGQPLPQLAPPMPWPGQVPTPAPAVVYRQPLAVEVHGVQGPVHVTARGEVTGSPHRLRLSHGQWIPVTAWAGPWLSDEQWWEPESHHRVSRFQLVVDQPGLDGQANQQAHLCRVQQNTWWIEATYD